MNINTENEKIKNCTIVKIINDKLQFGTFVELKATYKGENCMQIKLKSKI